MRNIRNRSMTIAAVLALVLGLRLSAYHFG